MLGAWRQAACRWNTTQDKRAVGEDHSAHIFEGIPSAAPVDVAFRGLRERNMNNVLFFFFFLSARAGFITCGGCKDVKQGQIARNALFYNEDEVTG